MRSSGAFENALLFCSILNRLAFGFLPEPSYLPSCFLGMVGEGRASRARTQEGARRRRATAPEDGQRPSRQGGGGGSGGGGRRRGVCGQPSVKCGHHPAGGSVGEEPSLVWMIYVALMVPCSHEMKRQQQRVLFIRGSLTCCGAEVPEWYGMHTSVNAGLRTRRVSRGGVSHPGSTSLGEIDRSFGRIRFFLATYERG